MIHAVLGGSFDPVHDGHVALAAHLLEEGLADRLVVVPARISPQKNHDHVPAQERLAMVRLAFADDPRVAVEDFEVGRPGPSFTVDTLRHLVSLRPTDRWRLVIGADHLATFATWRQPAAILEMARLLVFPRRGWPVVVPTEIAAERVQVVEGFDEPVSSSEIRAMLATGVDSVPGLPAPVLAHIRARGLYRP